MKDPESFCIPCTIGQCNFEKALCDLGANIKLVPLFIYKKLSLEGEANHNFVTFTNQFIKHLRGILEDFLAKVDKFIFPVDFILLDMEEDQEILIILKRPFLMI